MRLSIKSLASFSHDFSVLTGALWRLISKLKRFLTRVVVAVGVTNQGGRILEVRAVSLMVT